MQRTNMLILSGYAVVGLFLAFIVSDVLSFIVGVFFGIVVGISVCIMSVMDKPVDAPLDEQPRPARNKPLPQWRIMATEPEPTRNYVPALPETRKRGALPILRNRG